MPDCDPDFTAQTGQHGCMDGQDMTADLEMTTVEPRHWSSSAADVLLADGMIALIRPLVPGDREQVLALHEGVSQDTLRRRFFSTAIGTTLRCFSAIRHPS